MQTLLELFKEQEQKFSGIGVRGLHKLKYVFDSNLEDSEAEQDYSRMKFELRIAFRIIEALEPKDMHVMIDDTYKKIEKLEFNPTISGPNVVFRDKLRRDFSVWYKPIFYVPTANSARGLKIDFAFLRSTNFSMYAIDNLLKKELYSYEFLSDAMLKEISMKLLNKLKHVQLSMVCRQEVKASDIADIKAACYFLKPSRFLIVSEDYVPDAVKMNLPVNATLMENVDLNDRKIGDVAKQLL